MIVVRRPDVDIEVEEAAGAVTMPVKAITEPFVVMYTVEETTEAGGVNKEIESPGRLEGPEGLSPGIIGFSGADPSNGAVVRGKPEGGVSWDDRTEFNFAVDPVGPVAMESKAVALDAAEGSVEVGMVGATPGVYSR